MYENPKKILVVDDEPPVENMVRKKFRYEIEEGKYSFIFARNGWEALELISIQQVDVLVTDIKMEGMDGIQLLKRLRKTHSSLKTVVVTAFAANTDYIKGIVQVGANDFLPKPFNYSDLGKSIDRLLSLKPETIDAKSQPVETISSKKKTTNLTEKRVRVDSLPALIKKLPRQFRSEAICRTIDEARLNTVELDNVQDFIQTVRTLTVEEEKERAFFGNIEIERASKGELPLEALDGGYIETRVKKRVLPDGHEIKHTYYYLRWYDEDRVFHGRYLGKTVPPELRHLKGAPPELSLNSDNSDLPQLSPTSTVPLPSPQAVEVVEPKTESDIPLTPSTPKPPIKLYGEGYDQPTPNPEKKVRKSENKNSSVTKYKTR